MRTAVIGIVLAQAVLVAAFCVALRAGAMPLGVRGEWEWLRIAAEKPPGPAEGPGKTANRHGPSRRPPWYGVLFAISAVAVYAGFAGAGMRALSARSSPRREAVSVGLLLVVALAVSLIVPAGAPDEFDLTRWAYVPYFPGPTGYYRVAKEQVRDPWRFLAEYPDWVRRQDALHIGTHPPGMLLLEHGLLRGMETHPAAARFVVDALPTVVRDAFRYIGSKSDLPMADRAALGLTSALAWLACAATVVPLYLLARANLTAPQAWTAAALWPLVPSAVLFQPLADTAFPFLSTTALALAAWSGRAGRWGWVHAAGAGAALALGMAFTLAFLPVGLVVGIVLATAPGVSPGRRALAIGATGAGFLALTLLTWWLTRANPYLIWWWNQRNHARFYLEYPRTYRSWVVVNPIECALALGIPASVWAALGFSNPRRVPRSAWAALAVLLILNFSGRNLSEVARLWLPLMPPLLVAAASGMARFGGGFKILAYALALIGIEVLVLQVTIEVVYPVV